MNLKEAFRFQNKLQLLMDETQGLLSDDANVTKVKSTYLRKKTCAEAEDETVFDVPNTEYADRITDMVEFAVWLLGERERLFAAIRAAKDTLPIDIDSETSLNVNRQTAAKTLRRMADLRASEVVVPNGGRGYRFNAEGNQVPYKCDVRRVTTINFDRNVVRKRAAALSKRADAISAEIDRCVVNAVVDYTPPFDVNDSYADIFEAFIGQKDG